MSDHERDNLLAEYYLGYRWVTRYNLSRVVEPHLVDFLVQGEGYERGKYGVDGHPPCNFSTQLEDALTLVEILRTRYDSIGLFALKTSWECLIYAEDETFFAESEEMTQAIAQAAYLAMQTEKTR